MRVSGCGTKARQYSRFLDLFYIQYSVHTQRRIRRVRGALYRLRGVPPPGRKSSAVLVGALLHSRNVKKIIPIPLPDLTVATIGLGWDVRGGAPKGEMP
jgi:hypothetical protein